MKRRTKIIAAATAVTIAGGGAALALWSANGTGSGEARSLAAQNITVNVVTAAPALYPGFTTGLSFTLTNPNPYPVNFTGIALDGVVESDDQTACPGAANITITLPSTVDYDVAAGATTSTLTIPNSVTMNESALDGCQSRIFEIPLALTGSQTAP
jgi:hypothetical protein